MGLHRDERERGRDRERKENVRQKERKIYDRRNILTDALKSSRIN